MQALAKFRRFSAAVASEDEPGLKWDRCVADLIVKTGTVHPARYNNFFGVKPNKRWPVDSKGFTLT